MEWFKKNWKFLAVVAAAVLLLAVVLVVVLTGFNNGPDDEPGLAGGPETGLYYYDTAEGEYVLSITVGNHFTIAGPSLNKSGKIVATENGVELDFVKDEDGTGSLKEESGVLTLQYKDITMRFLKKETYAVTFQSNGGSEVKSVNVVNGKTAAKPADPVKEGYVFIGWYTDEACTQLYPFGSQIVTADTTVYAKWAQSVVGQSEYTISFDLGYEVEGFDAMTTVGGKLYNAPTPAREGYTFGGWWISMTQQADRLTYAYNQNVIFQANTTLFALWETETTGGKLESPKVEVIGDSITWNAVKGASTYRLTIKNAKGELVHEENPGTTSTTFAFSENSPGEYVIEVIAQASVSEKNSEPAVRYYINKALDRVSQFTVVDGGVLLWNRVEGAEKYVITISCGDHEHKHTQLENGNSTTYVFAGCAMQPGGIRFTVTAVAEGKADSVSDTFVYERNLESVGQILYNTENQSFYWTAVQGAAKYLITVSNKGEAYIVDNGSATSFSVKNLSGEITLAVVPATKGYNSPEASTVTYTKTSLAVPEGLTVNGTVVNWDAVEGATAYMVKINSQSYRSEDTSVELNELLGTLDRTAVYEISVMAMGTENSLYSDVLKARYLSDIEKVTYHNNTLTWTPVLGASEYEVRVNGGKPIPVTGKNYTNVVLTQPGINTIEVRYTDLGGGNWSSTEVFAYAVIYDSRSVESSVITEYLAKGDTMTFPTGMKQSGFDFTGWYNVPDAAAGNGEAYTDTVFTGNGTMILYGNWVHKTYYIEFVGVDPEITNVKDGDRIPVTYKSTFTLPVPVNPNADGDFSGWYTEPGASGIRLTDSKGNCITAYDFPRDTKAYPYFDTGVLEYIEQENGTYAVTAGPSIKNVANVRIPEFYKGKAVTAIMENAFVSAPNMERLEIPATIESIGVGAIPNYETLREIVVYEDTIQQDYEVFYTSHEGALLRHDMGVVYLEIFPRAKTGEYVIPDYVNVLRDKVFRFVSITKLTVGTGVTEIMQNAFYQCGNLEILEFKGAGTAPLTIDPDAFYRTANIKTLRLPARLAEMNLHTLDGFTKLTVLEMEEGGINYSTRDNMICNAIGDTILYAPKSISGEYEVPLGIRAIDDKAFANRTALTKLVIPSYVTRIGVGAFQNCTGIIEVVVEGDRTSYLFVDTQAFVGCDNLTTVTFKGNGGASLDKGATTVGTSAFEGLAKLRNLVIEAGARVEIGHRAFAGNKNLANPVYNSAASIPTIGVEAFAGCTALTNLEIPNTTESVGDGAYSGCTNLYQVSFAPNGKQVEFGTNVFAGCSSLFKVTLSASIREFDGSVFDGCEALAEIQVDENSQYFASHNGALYAKDYSEIKFYPRALDGDLSKLHPDLKKIGATVFKGNTKITKIVIGKNVVAIGDNAFDNCFNLESVTFEPGTTAMSIGAGAFARCTKLTKIELPACTDFIGISAFESSGLTEFTIPEDIQELPMNVFKGTMLTSIRIPANVITICDGAFASTPLQTITFADSTKPLTLGTLENIDKQNGVFYGTKITVFDVHDRITFIGAYAFYNQTSLKTVTMGPNSNVEEIGNYAFAVESGTSALTSVTLGSKVVTIGSNAFYKASIKKINIPKSVTWIRYRALAATTLETVTFETGGTKNLAIENEAFFGTKFKTITLPARLTTAYEVTSWKGKSSFKNFGDLFKNNTALAAVEVESGNTNFTAIDGVVYELNYSGVADTLLYCPSAKKGTLVIPKVVRKVENGAFINTKLTTIRFEEYDKGDANYGNPLLEVGNVTTIHDGSYPDAAYAVFAPANKITIELPSHLKSIGLLCFTNLKSNSVIKFNMAAHLKSIEDGAFKDCAYLKTLEIPAVDQLGNGVFYGCVRLTAVTFGAESRFTELPAHMFMNCTALQEFAVPASVRTIGGGAFRGCTALTSVTFPEDSKLESIGTSAFMETALVEFAMPDTVVVVGTQVFDGVDTLKTLKLSKNLYALGGLLHHCDSLETLIMPEGGRYYKTIDGVLYDIAETVLYFYPRTKDPTGFKMPDTVTTLAAYSMAYYPGTTLELPENLDTIEEYALAYSNVASLAIPRNVKEIKNAAMIQMKNLETLVFVENGKLTTIADSAFAGCSKLQSLTLPDNVSSIGVQAFSSCSSLTEVILPAALTNLQRYAFRNCTNLTKFVMQEGLQFIEGNVLSDENSRHLQLKEITIPSTVREIGMYAFQHHTSLERVYFAEGSQLQVLANFVFEDCVSLKSIVLPASIIELPEFGTTVQGADGSYIEQQSRLFKGCTSLKSVDMSACVGLTVLPTKMFEGCVSLETVVLPPNLVTMHNYAFCGATGLKEITIPASVTDLGGYTFDGCTSLETVIFAENSELTQLGTDELRPDAPQWGTHIFSNTPALKTVVLPKNLVSIGISCFENSGIENIALPGTLRIVAEKGFKNCDNLVTADLSAELLYLGNEAYYDCDKLETADLTFGLEYLGACAFAYCEQLRNAYIPASVTSIAGNPYMGCSGIENFNLDKDSVDFVIRDGVLYNKEMTTLLYYPANLIAETFTFPDSVREIGYGAFAGAQLKNLVLPEKILNIPDYAFNNSALETVTFHRGLQSIGAYAFEGCRNLNDVTILYSIKEVGDYAFANCTGLTNFVFEEIPVTVTPTVLGTHLLDGCTGITAVVLHDRMTSIPAYMFANTGITNVVIPAYITDMSTEGVFYGCSQLEHVTFEAMTYEAKTYLGAWYFYGCSKLKEITIPHNVTMGRNWVFGECTSLEKFTLYTPSRNPSLGGQYCFYNCGNLEEYNILRVTAFKYDDNGKVIGYAAPTPVKRGALVTGYCFAGCYKLDVMSLHEFPYNQTYMENVFGGFPNPVVVLKDSLMFWQSEADQLAFANAPDLKEVWMNPTELALNAATFTNVAGELKVFFYNHTFEEIVAKAQGSTAWYEEASSLVTFYFKDTIPEDQVWPEELQS